MQNKKDYNLKIGRHLPNKQSTNNIIGALLKSIEYKSNAFAIFLFNPLRFIPITSIKYITDEFVSDFNLLLKKNNFLKENIVVHSSYITNLCSSDETLVKNSIEIIISEIKLMDKLGLKTLVLHPGFNLDNKIGKLNVIKNLNFIFSITKDTDIKIAIENGSGKSNQICYTLEDIKEVLDSIIDKAHYERIGVCIDICHLFASGVIPIIKENEKYKEIDLNKTVNTINSLFNKKVLVYHINNSKFDFGKKQDVHANLDKGRIEKSFFYNFVNHPGTNNIIKILETPYNDSNKEEIEYLKS